MSQSTRYSISLGEESSSARDHLLEGQDGDLKSPQRPRAKAWRACTAYSILLHIILILIYTLIFLFIISPEKSPRALIDADVVPYTPAQRAIKYKKVLIDSTVYAKSPYSGNPSREIDHAWNELMSGFNLRVSKETLANINRTSIPISDGSGTYIAGLDTTHHLHCLQSIRHALAPEYYAAEIAAMAKPEGEVYPTHISHCLEILREIILCKASGSLFTYAWSPTQKEPLTNFAVEHTCVDWERLQRWTWENSFPIREDLLVHPIYGKWPGDGPV